MRPRPSEARSGETQHDGKDHQRVAQRMSQRVSQMACNKPTPHDTSRHETLSEHSPDKGRARL